MLEMNSSSFFFYGLHILCPKKLLPSPGLQMFELYNLSILFIYTIHFKIFTNGMIEGPEPFPYKWISHFYFTVCQNKYCFPIELCWCLFYSDYLIKFWEDIVLGETRGFVHVRQAPYRWALSPALSCHLRPLNI